MLLCRLSFWEARSGLRTVSADASYRDCGTDPVPGDLVIRDEWCNLTTVLVPELALGLVLCVCRDSVNDITSFEELLVVFSDAPAATTFQDLG